MDYRKPSKTKANEAYLRNMAIQKVRPYREEQIDPKKTFLIICEGENTEPAYFRGFPVATKTVIIEGGCNSKNSLVDYALEQQKREEYAGREIWCVFDFDRKPDEAATQPQDFNSAIIKAHQNGLKVAWSNDAFELWFVLHYQRVAAAHSRHQLYPILQRQWEIESFDRIAKTREFCESHYQRHGGSESGAQQLAIRYAKELHQKYKERQDYAQHCPCTTVYQLVEELNKYLKR